MARIRTEAGATTIVVLALSFALVVAAWGAGSIVATVVAHRVAQNAADLAALAAAADHARARDGCASASVVAAANRARVVSCLADGDAVVVEVAVDTRFGVGITVRARARAGPVRDSSSDAEFNQPHSNRSSSPMAPALSRG